MKESESDLPDRIDSHLFRLIVSESLIAFVFPRPLIKKLLRKDIYKGNLVKGGYGNFN